MPGVDEDLAADGDDSDPPLWKLAVELALLVLGLVVPAVGAAVYARVQALDFTEAVQTVAFAAGMAFALAAVITRFFLPDDGWRLWLRILRAVSPPRMGTSALGYESLWNDRRTLYRSFAPFRFLAGVLCMWAVATWRRPAELAALWAAVGSLMFGIELAILQDLKAATAHALYLLAALLVLGGAEEVRRTGTLNALVPGFLFIGAASLLNAMVLQPGEVPTSNMPMFFAEMVGWDVRFRWSLGVGGAAGALGLAAVVVGEVCEFLGRTRWSSRLGSGLGLLGTVLLLLAMLQFIVVGAIDLYWVKLLVNEPVGIFYTAGLFGSGFSALLFALVLFCAAANPRWLSR